MSRPAAPSERLAESGERHSSVAFSSFRLDYRTGRLTRAGRPIPLRPKSWAVLAYLLERPGLLVSTEELLDAVWTDVSVTPDTVRKSIGELRRALGDDTKEPKLIETVRRRGFRFIGDVRTEELADVGTDAMRSPASSSSRFVGRAGELHQLWACLSRAGAGEPRIAFVTGEPGIGKTSLVDEFLHSTSRGMEPPRVGCGTCVEQHGPLEPYLPVLDALGRFARRADATSLPGLLLRFAPTWLAQLPWLLPPDAGDLRGTLGETRPERMLREFAVLLEELSRDRPLVLHLEDLQWADAATVDLLSFLGRRREPARWLLIGTYRPAEVVAYDHPLGGAARELVAHGLATQVSLPGFTTAEIERYLEARFPGASFGGSLAEQLSRHTGGNPLFVSATLDHLRSNGWILETSPGWELREGLDFATLEVPDDARRMITAQLRALSPTQRDLLSTASVVGRRFLSRTVAEASGSSPARGEDLLDALSDGERFVRSARVGLGHARFTSWGYEFVHELYRRAVYDEIPPARRASLHRRVAQALERTYEGRVTDVASDLARHYESAGDCAKAIEYLKRTAALAQERFAPREAVHLLEEAITLTQGVEDERLRQTHELETRLALAVPVANLHGLPSGALLQNCERAHELAVAVGRDDQRFESAYALFHVYATRADAERIPGAERELEDLARRVGSPAAILLADSLRLRVAVLFGEFQKAHDLMQGQLGSAGFQTSSHDVSRFGADPLLGARSHHAVGLWFLGEIQEAEKTSAACLAVAREPTTPPLTRCMELLFASLLGVLTRNPDAARKHAEEAEALARDQGFGLWEAIASGLVGWARVHTGEPESGIQNLERATRRLADFGMRMFSTSLLAYRAEAHLQIGDPLPGLEVVEEGLRIAESTLDRMCWPELWRLKAELLFAAGISEAPESPESCARRALEIARRSRARSLELRAASTWVRVSRGRPRDEARARLADLCQSFARDLSTPDLVEARALMGESDSGRLGP